MRRSPTRPNVIRPTVLQIPKTESTESPWRGLGWAYSTQPWREWRKYEKKLENGLQNHLILNWVRVCSFSKSFFLKLLTPASRASDFAAFWKPFYYWKNAKVISDVLHPPWPVRARSWRASAGSRGASWSRPAKLLLFLFFKTTTSNNNQNKNNTEVSRLETANSTKAGSASRSRLSIRTAELQIHLFLRGSSIFIDIGENHFRGKENKTFTCYA